MCNNKEPFSRGTLLHSELSSFEVNMVTLLNVAYIPISSCSLLHACWNLFCHACWSQFNPLWTHSMGNVDRVLPGISSQGTSKHVWCRGWRHTECLASFKLWSIIFAALSMAFYNSKASKISFCPHPDNALLSKVLNQKYKLLWS